jgi:glycosyltransferase involved in cell wall biosynthesis
LIHPPRLTLLILAINAEKELARILPELRDIGDELVIGIDDTTTDATAEVARQFTAQIHPVPHEGFRGKGGVNDLNAVECMLPYCDGDWLLRVDQDETLSAIWHDPSYVSSLLLDRAATHYAIPRRLVVPPGDRYVCSGVWCPDYQLRLYRNIPSLIQFNRRPHDLPRIAGEGRFLSDAWILHWDPVWYDRARRDQKVAFYLDLGYRKEECDLHDEKVFQTRPLDYIYPRLSMAAARTSTGSNPFHASLEVLDWPEVLQAGKLEPVFIGIRNDSNRLFYPTSTFVRPANVSLSYHWYTRDRELYRWEGQRHDLPTRLQPGDSTSYFVNVVAPEEPGDYLFQPDLVEEHVAWFSGHCPMPFYPMRVV